MLDQKTLYTIGLILVIVLALQYLTYVMIRKMVREEVKKNFILSKRKNIEVTGVNNQNTVQQNKEETEDSQSIEIETPKNDQEQDQDSYVNPLPSNDNDE